MNKIWTRICPILGLLLLLSVFPLLSVQVVSDGLFCDPSESSNNQSTSTSKCVSGCNFSPDGDRRVLNAVLSTHTEHGNGELLLPKRKVIIPIMPIIMAS